MVVAVHQGLIDIDPPPFVAYSVTPVCNDGSRDCWRCRSQRLSLDYIGLTSPFALCVRAVKCPSGFVCPTDPPSWVDNVIIRHLLAQSEGCVSGKGCTAPLGTTLIHYDSDQYIDPLPDVRQVAAPAAPRWAHPPPG